MASSCFAPRDVLSLLTLHYPPPVANMQNHKESISEYSLFCILLAFNFSKLFNFLCFPKVVGKSLVVRRVVFWCEMDKAPLRNSASEWRCFHFCAVFWGTGFPGAFGISPVQSCKMFKYEISQLLVWRIWLKSFRGVSAEKSVLKVTSCKWEWYGRWQGDLCPKDADCKDDRWWQFIVRSPMSPNSSSFWNERMLYWRELKGHWHFLMFWSRRGSCKMTVNKEESWRSWMPSILVLPNAPPKDYICMEVLVAERPCQWISSFLHWKTILPCECKGNISMSSCTTSNVYFIKSRLKMVLFQRDLECNVPANAWRTLWMCCALMSLLWRRSRTAASSCLCSMPSSCAEWL